jgi:glycine/D-amino acid oxidase-like deaminating enzyme
MTGAQTYDALVIGAGVMGASTALFLARGGMRVALLDRGGICREASGVNAGTLTMHMTRAALIPYALEGWRMWTTAADWLGADVGVTQAPGLTVAFTGAEEDLIHQRAAARGGAGAPIRVITPAEARAIEPGLSLGIRAAAHCPIDGHVTAYLTGRGFAGALRAAGCDLIEGLAVTGLDHGPGGYALRCDDAARDGQIRAPRVVLAGGVWLEPMLRWLGLEVPIKVLVNQLAVTERMPPVMRSVLSVASGLLSLKQFANGTVLIGGGWQGRGDRERGGHELIPEALVGNVRLAAHVIPALRDTRVLRAWLGLEAETADAMPVIGPVPGHPGAFVIGSVHSGYTSGPYMGRLLAQAILGAEPERPLFPIDRLLATSKEPAA